MFLIMFLNSHSANSGRKIYHTLDLHNISDDGSTSEEEAEHDWLVKRAKKEGLEI